jgi:shikimate kinase
MWTSFIGFMASGKTTLTRRLQATSNRPAVFLDEIIVAKAGDSIAEIFANRGEDHFRKLELAALQELDPDRNFFIDTGGGIVHTPEAVELLRERGVLIWLDASWDVIRARLKGESDKDRPLIDRLGWAGLEQLFRQRRPLYAAVANFRLQTGDLRGEQLAKVARLRSLIWERRREGDPE